MKTLGLFVLFGFICYVLAVEVKELTPETFDSVIDGSKPAFVTFYASWYHHFSFF
jgi:hypothetical protein